MELDKIKKAMMSAIKHANITMLKDLGGPFGAAVINDQGDLISVSSNSVLDDHDPTAHAEINAIRKACQILNTHDLSGYIMVTTAFPCPMCLGAILWSNISHMIYGCSLDDAKNIGFRDDLFYSFICEGMKNKDMLEIEQCLREDCITLFNDYQSSNKTIY